MKFLPILFIFCAFAFSPKVAFAQNTKGVTPTKTGNAQPATGQTYAVVVGISDYQDEGIPDLRFADKDAEAFAGFLQSPAGGSLDEDHLKVLLNEKATVAQFAIQLDWLMEVAGENDRVIVYFSGHGDVERRTITQPGYLLCWDAPSKIYLAGGALALPMFQDVITTLSVQNKAKVVVITDACRSGKLSGSSVGGAQITGSNLAKQYANEIKILSCQPDEFSIEGEQWGGGRGAFSYHLLDGLSGMADGNADNAVNLREIRNYLEENVTEEVAPQSQNPMIIGNKMEKLSDVFPELLAKIKEGKKGQMQLFTATESRGIEDDVLAAADSNIVELYFAFKKALEDKQFLFAESGRAENDYADFYYKKLSKEPQLERLHSSMRRNYAAALQDDAQQVMNEWMKTSDDRMSESEDEEEKEGKLSRLPKKIFTEKVKAFPACIERAAELLGENHYMYATLQARKHFFKGYLSANENKNYDPKKGNEALAEFNKALHWQPELPQAYWQMSRVYGYKMQQPDSAEVYTQKAIALYPTWVVPYAKLAFMFSTKYDQFDRAKSYLDQAVSIDSVHLDVLNTLGAYYDDIKQYEKAEAYYKKAIRIDSTFIWPYNNLGILFKNTKKYEKAEAYYKKAIRIDSTVAKPYVNLGILYAKTLRNKKAIKYYKKAIDIDSTYFRAMVKLGDVYADRRQFDEAEKYYKKAIDIDSTYFRAMVNLGDVYSDRRQFDEAEKYYKKAIDIDSTYARNYSKLVQVYFAKRQFDEGEKYKKKALQLDSTNKYIYYEIALANNTAHRYDDAIKYYKKAIELDSTYMIAINNLGTMLMVQERWEEAENYFKKSVQIDSLHAPIYVNLGFIYIYTEGNRFDEAEAAFRKAKSLNEKWTFPYIHIGLGEVNMEKGEYIEAEAQLKKGIELNDRLSFAYIISTDLYLRTNRLEEAKATLDKVIEIDPENTDIPAYRAKITLKNNQPDKAWEHLTELFEAGHWKFKKLNEEPDFKLLHQDPKWKALMQKHFPDQYKSTKE